MFMTRTEHLILRAGCIPATNIKGGHSVEVAIFITLFKGTD